MLQTISAFSAEGTLNLSAVLRGLGQRVTSHQAAAAATTTTTTTTTVKPLQCYPLLMLFVHSDLLCTDLQER